MEHQGGGEGQVAAFDQVQLLEQGLVRLFEHGLGQALALERHPAEGLERPGVEIRQPEARPGHAIPGPTVLAQQEAVQRRSSR